MNEITRLLKASIAREQNKGKREEQLEAEVKRLRAVLTVSANYLETPLQSVENLLRTDPSLLDYEALADYSLLARFMFAAHGRRNLVEIAEKRMREMSA